MIKSYSADELRDPEIVHELLYFFYVEEAFITPEGRDFLFSCYGIEKLYEILKPDYRIEQYLTEENFADYTEIEKFKLFFDYMVDKYPYVSESKYHKPVRFIKREIKDHKSKEEIIDKYGITEAVYARINQEILDENEFKANVEKARKMCTQFYEEGYIAEKLGIPIKTVRCIKKECDIYKWHYKHRESMEEKISRYSKLRTIVANQINSGAVNSMDLTAIKLLSKDLIPSYEEATSYLKWYIDNTDNLSEIKELETIMGELGDYSNKCIYRIITDYYDRTVSWLNNIKKFYESLPEE